jgi:hypothetical protein
LLAPLQESQKTVPRAEEQLALIAQYRQQFQQGLAPYRLQDVGFSAHSQHEEDGILLYIFALVGTTDKRCVELCAGTGIECNTANLIVNHKWSGLLVDGDERNVATGRDFYAQHHNTRVWPPKFVREWVTRGNVNRIISGNGFSGDIDLLSIDVDGVDYWLWEAIDSISPRVLVTEINHLWGPERAVTVPYRDDFVGGFTEHGSDYAGASLAAFVKLGRKKGYRLVGTNAFATNAFFVRNDIRCDWLPEVDPATCFGHPRAQFGMQVRHAGIKDREWQDV